MTDDLPQLVQRLRSIIARAQPMFDETAATDLRNRFSLMPAAVQESWLRSARETATVGLDVLAIRDAATALDTLTRALAERTQERDAALALAGRQSVVLTELGDRYADEFNRAESATAAVREARAETWAQAGGGRKQP